MSNLYTATPRSPSVHHRVTCVSTSYCSINFIRLVGYTLVSRTSWVYPGHQNKKVLTLGPGACWCMVKPHCKRMWRVGYAGQQLACSLCGNMPHCLQLPHVKKQHTFLQHKQLPLVAGQTSFKLSDPTFSPHSCKGYLVPCTTPVVEPRRSSISAASCVPTSNVPNNMPSCTMHLAAQSHAMHNADVMLEGDHCNNFVFCSALQSIEKLLHSTKQRCWNASLTSVQWFCHAQLVQLLQLQFLSACPKHRIKKHRADAIACV